MTPSRARDTSFGDVLVIGKRLGLLLIAVAAYYIAAGLVAQKLQIPVIDRGSLWSERSAAIGGIECESVGLYWHQRRWVYRSNEW